jgi:hypothetical protein
MIGISFWVSGVADGTPRVSMLNSQRNDKNIVGGAASAHNCSLWQGTGPDLKSDSVHLYKRGPKKCPPSLPRDLWTAGRDAAVGWHPTLRAESLPCGPPAARHLSVHPAARNFLSGARWHHRRDFASYSISGHERLSCTMQMLRTPMNFHEQFELVNG